MYYLSAASRQGLSAAARRARAGDCGFGEIPYNRQHALLHARQAAVPRGDAGPARSKSVRSSPDKHQEKARVRLALLRAALSLAAEHGFTSLGLREVSRAAGIAPTSFYRHFADMHELGLSLIDELASPLLQAATARAREVWREGRDGNLELIDQLQRAAREDPNLMRFILAARHGATPAFRERLRALMATMAASTRAESVAAPSALVNDLVAAMLSLCCETQLDPAARARVRDAIERVVAPPQEGRHA